MEKMTVKMLRMKIQLSVDFILNIMELKKCARRMNSNVFLVLQIFLQLGTSYFGKNKYNFLHFSGSECIPKEWKCDHTVRLTSKVTIKTQLWPNIKNFRLTVMTNRTKIIAKIRSTSSVMMKLKVILLT